MIIIFNYSAIFIVQIVRVFIGVLGRERRIRFVCRFEVLSKKSSVIKRTFVFFFSLVSYGLRNNDIFMFNESLHHIKPNEWYYPNEYGIDYLGFIRENPRFHDASLSSYRIIEVGDND